MAESETAAPSALIGIPEIAAIADVGPSAVGNWRKRHPDFPKPKVQAPAGSLFDLDDVEKWLIENGKITRRVPPFMRLRALTDSARAVWQPHEVSQFSVACLVYLEACARAGDPGEPQGQPAPVVPAAASWTRVRQEARPAQFVKSLQAAAAEIEKLNRDLEGLIAPGFSRLQENDGAIARSIALAIDDATDDDVTPRFALLDDAASGFTAVAEPPRGQLSRHVLAELTEADRFSADLSTPDDLAYLMVQSVGATGGTIFDPAAGECGLLLLAALWQPGGRGPRLVGVEVNETVWRTARSRCYLYEMPADIRLGNAFRADPAKLPKADVVVLDPPYGMSNWGDADVYLHKRWIFGPPPPKSADFAWLQLAVLQLKPGGRAAVLMPSGTLTRSGQEAQIRHAMLQAGVIEGIVLLPPRLRANTSIPLAMWLMRSPEADQGSDEVLLVDASDLARPGRSRHSLEEATIDRLGQLVEDWRARHQIDTGNMDIAVAVPVGSIEDASLDPKRYRKASQVNVDALEARVQQGRARVMESMQVVRDSLALLGDYLDGSR
jgi:type I restriction enzyme M protein